jgi:hypothetical protein
MGLRIIVRPYPRVEIPWHRKKRIAKKWRKARGPRYTYPNVNEREILSAPRAGILYVYPRMEAELRTLLKEWTP